MKTLLLAGDGLSPATSGYRLRMAHLADQLGAHLTLDVAALGASAADPVGRYTLHPFPPGPGRVRALAGSLRQPYLAARLKSPAMAALAAQKRWQTVQAESPFLVGVARRAGVPVVMDAHNVEHHTARLVAREDRRPVHRARWRWEAAKIARLERQVCGTVDAVCATSEEDAETFRAMGAARVVVVPNGVDVAAYPARPSGPALEPGPARLVYAAHFGYLPNQMAAIELADHILPRVRLSHPEATLALVGREPGDALLRRRGPAVEVTGAVDDVRPYLRDASVVVVPLRAGSGTRLKILEAMAAGVPVVSTGLGASGLGLEAGRHYLGGESPADLADQAGRVLDDPRLAAALAAAARAEVERRFDWAVVARPLVELHLDLGRAA